MVKQRTKNVQKIVVKKRRNGRKQQAILQPFNPNQLRFHSGSNSLMGQVQSLQTASASAMGGSQMLGTTGNFYLDNLVDPFRGPCRIPDEYTRPTAVHQSFIHQDITTDDNGEVTISLNPIWGDGATAAVRNRWVAVSQPSIGGVPVTTYYDDPDYAALVTSGVVAGARPVSAAFLITYVGDTLTDGGQISNAWIPGDTSAARISSFFSVGTARGKLSLEPGAHNGAFKDGGYTFWKPDDIEDYEFQTPTAQLSHNYPLLVACLKSTQPNKVVARLVAVTNHEVTTSTRVLETKSGLVEPDLVLHSKKILATFPSSCANEEHVTLWQKIQRGCEDFFRMVGTSFRNLFAPSLADINQNAAGINAVGNLIGSIYNPLGNAAKGAAGAAVAAAE